MRRSIATDDLFRLHWLDTPRISPDGALIAYVEGSLDRERDTAVSRVCLVPTGGGPLRCITPAGASDEQPCWSAAMPGGEHGQRLAFVSDRAGGRRLWVYEPSSGSARQIAALDGVDSPTWSPDGAHLACVAPGQDAEGTPARKQLWIIPAAGGEPARCAAGDGDAAVPAWSPDGRYIAFLSNRTVTDPGSPVRDLWIIAAAGGEPRRLTAGTSQIRALAWSPDSRAIAFIGHDRGDSPAANFGVWLAPLDGSPPRPLTATLDRSVGLTVRADTPEALGAPDLAWLAVGERERIYFCYADRGRSWLGSADPAGALCVAVGGERAVLAFDASVRADRLAFVVADGARPSELHAADLDGRREATVVSPNAGWLSGVTVARPEYRPFRADDGEVIDAWYLRPPGDSGGVPPPLILQVHGGPHYPLGERFYFEFQRLAARGYALVYANPRGSQGYGERFAAAIRGAWGDRDALDLEQALHTALLDGIGDPRRLGVTGVSYGGYMTQWLIARDPQAGGHRFAAAVSENGLTDLAGMWDASAAARSFYTWELDGTPQTHPERFRDRSPVTRAGRVRTPLLLIHAEQDQTCPIGESERAHAALVAQGATVDLVRIPGEGHLMNLIGRPRARLLRTARLDEWFARYLAPPRLTNGEGR